MICWASVEVRRSPVKTPARNLSSSPIHFFSLSPVTSSSAKQSPGTLVAGPSDPLGTAQKHDLDESPCARAARTKRSRIATAPEDVQKQLVMTCAIRANDLSQQLTKLSVDLQELRTANLVILSDDAPAPAYGAHNPSDPNTWVFTQRLDRLITDMAHHMGNMQLTMATALELKEQWQTLVPEDDEHDRGDVTADERDAPEQGGPGLDGEGNGNGGGGGDGGNDGHGGENEEVENDGHGGEHEEDEDE
ncbi:hypothetical protein MBLNU459_g6716t2 [Dothideomycetes sp. NU459]